MAIPAVIIEVAKNIPHTILEEDTNCSCDHTNMRRIK